MNAPAAILPRQSQHNSGCAASDLDSDPTARQLGAVVEDPSHPPAVRAAAAGAITSLEVFYEAALQAELENRGGHD